ncbi:hypothetical protein EYF80_044600 [Liparis tanakae]|uniref:Uncharacterized protein n=1 Tax=Liparis tanakae TaxID=230148 RepID=A0A4Z2FWA3_9TELE|nr:hypothetical protein EYF80_044600 [Liparis tanakae]
MVGRSWTSQPLKVIQDKDKTQADYKHFCLSSVLQQYVLGILLLFASKPWLFRRNILRTASKSTLFLKVSVVK